MSVPSCTNFTTPWWTNGTSFEIRTRPGVIQAHWTTSPKAEHWQRLLTCAYQAVGDFTLSCHFGSLFPPGSPFELPAVLAEIDGRMTGLE